MDDLLTFEVTPAHFADPARVAALEESGLATLRNDAVLDRLTRLVTWGTGAPIALITVVEPTRQVFVSAQGLSPALEEARETPLAQSLCQYVVANDELLIVDDARLHPALHEHPGVLENEVVAYAGYPVHHPDGTVLGTVCAADTASRTWRIGDLIALEDIAALVEMDIAHRVRRAIGERQLAQVQGVLDGAPSTAILVAGTDGLITFASRGAADLLALEAEGLIGLLHLDDLALLWHPMTGRATPDGAKDWLITDADGCQRVITARRTELRDPQGRLTGSMLLCDDVSARHRAERLLLDTVKKQEAAVKQLKALDQARNEFIATASHELRTPVTSILGYSEMLSDGTAGPLNEQQNAMLDRVTRNSERLLLLIGDLLTLSESAAGEHQPVWTTVDVGAVARQAWDAVSAHLIGRTLDARAEIPAAASPVRGDPAELERIIINLVANAVKYTPDGGSVRLVVRRDRGEVVVSVTDTGIGIDACEHGRVFEPFYRGHDAQQRAIQGSGLGLALVRRLTEAHGGEVRLESQRGIGTTVSIVLPLRA